MSATDELRRLLDERGVEWGNVRRDGSTSKYLTEWQFEDNQGKAIAIEWSVGSGLSVEIRRYHLTPEQAIDATLGADAKPTQAESSGTCEMEYVSDWMSWHCKACDQMDMAPRNPKPRYCKWCGRKVVGDG